MNRLLAFAVNLSLSTLCSIVSSGIAFADAGVLVPEGRQQPDPAIFSLDEMSIDIVIDGSMARVNIRQIYGSHSGSLAEGQYLFALPESATVSDFAVWDGMTRIPRVILERKRAGEIYQQAK